MGKKDGLAEEGVGGTEQQKPEQVKWNGELEDLFGQLLSRATPIQTAFLLNFTLFLS